ncbi:MAG: deoxycytidine triphosphate deaminase [Cytophagales bacterium]|jgi:dCTP deaminase|nr:deoxycytidine triphosphate deaminase [Cytophagales bacterium]
MAFIGTNNLTTILKNSDVILPFDEGRIKNGAYELSLGAQVFQTDSSPRAVKELKEKEKIEIKPGQFALLLTKEYVKIPKDKIAFISIKAGVKFKGLVNVSGFHVDPGFEGNLLFSVYNAGPSNIILSNGTPYFPIWFSELNETQEYKGNHDKQTSIPDEPVSALSQGELASPNALSKRIDDNQKESDKRIGLIEKEQKVNNYLATTAVGLGIVILVKFALDWAVFNTGINKGTELKQKEVAADSIINQRLIEKKNLLIEIDSLKKVKAETVKQNSQAPTKPNK